MTKPFSVWQRLKTALDSKNPADPMDSEQKIRLAAAVLMVEMARADNDHHEAERQTLVQQLTQRFGLALQEASELVETAEKTADRSISLHEHLATLNAGLDRAQKQAVFKMLWQVAYADNRLDRYEEHLLRKIADLLYLDHSDYIRLKHEVMGQA